MSRSSSTIHMVGEPSDQVHVYGRRGDAWGNSWVGNWRIYFLTPMVTPRGDRRVSAPMYATTMHTGLVMISEFLLRVFLSFAYVGALSSFNSGGVNAALAVFIKAAALGGVVAIFGPMSSYARFEHLVASWWPSSKRMFGPRSIQPYLDVGRVIAATIAQFVGSLVGIALYVWFADLNSANQGNPGITSDALGTLGSYDVDVHDIWLIEIFGSAIITLAWLLAVVYPRGVKHNVYLGIVMFLAVVLAAGPAITASGANFDVIHYSALRTITGKTGFDRHTAAYILAPLLGAALAWIGYLTVSFFAYSSGYSRPGIPEINNDDLRLPDAMQDYLGAPASPLANIDGKFRGRARPAGVRWGAARRR